MNTNPSPVSALDVIATQEISCPLCGGDEYQKVLQAKDFIYGIGEEFTFVRCNTCKHLYLNPRPADDSLGACYPKTYGPHQGFDLQQATIAQDAGSPSTTVSPKLFWRRAFRQIPLLRGFLCWLGQQYGTVMPPLPENAVSSISSPGDHARLLEIGCAHGGFLGDAQAAGWVVDGLEPNLDAANQALSHGFDVQTKTLSEASFTSESRHAVVAWMVLEHVPDPAFFTAEVFRILTKGGLLCVSIPNAGAPERRLFGKYWLGYDAPRHLQLFTSARIHELLTESGFTDVKITHQASLRYWWGSIAAWGMEQFPEATWPGRWMACFIGEPSKLARIALLVPEKLISLTRLSGRITVSARKPS